jgi:hypothetical protein
MLPVCLAPAPLGALVPLVCAWALFSLQLLPWTLRDREQ